MSFNLGSAYADISIDTSGISTAVEEAQSSIQSLGKSLQSIGGNIASFGAKFSLAVGVPVSLAAKTVITAASDMNESLTKTGVIFGSVADEIVAFASTADTSMGMSQQSALDAASTFATFGKAAGLTGSDLSTFSTGLVSLASDMASFHNTTTVQAIEAIGAALRGESEPIGAYTVLLGEAALQARAFEMKIYDGTGVLTQQQRVLATQAEILAKTSDAQGDFARTSSGLANQQRILSAQFSNIAVIIGQAFLPVALEISNVLLGLTPILTSLSTQFSNASPTVKKLVAALGIALIAIGPLTIAIGGLVSAIGTMLAVGGTIAAGFASPFVLASTAVVAAIAGLMNVFDVSFSSIADTARSWGLDTVAQFADGMGAGIQYVVGVISDIASVIADWFQPNSPPKIAPQIDSWGTLTMQEWINGFSQADFSVLSNITSELESYFREISPESPALIDFIENLRNATAETVSLAVGGLSASESIAKLEASIGDIPAALEGVITAELALIDIGKQLEAANLAVENATMGLKAAQEAAEVVAGRVKIAQEGVATAQDKVSEASKRLSDAQDVVAQAGEKVKIAQDGVAEAQNVVADAQENLNRVTKDYDALLSPLNDQLEALRDKLGDVRDAYDEAVSPLNDQLSAIDKQRDAIKDRQKLAEIEEKLKDGSLTADERSLLLLEQQEIALQNQIDAEKEKFELAEKGVEAQIKQQEEAIKALEKNKAIAISAEKAKIEQAEKGVELAKLAVAQAEKDVELLRAGVVEAEKGVKLAQSGVDVANEKLKSVQKEYDQAQAVVATAQDNVDLANDKLSAVQKIQAEAENELAKQKLIWGEYQKQNDLLKERQGLVDKLAEAETKGGGRGGAGIKMPESGGIGDISTEAEKASTAIGKVSDKLTATSASITAFTTQAREGISSFATSISSGLSSIIAFGSSILTALSPIGNAISAAFAPVSSAITELMGKSSSFTPLLDGLKNLFGELVDLATPLAQVLGGVLVTVIGLVSSAVSALISAFIKIAPILSNVLLGIVQVVTGIVNVITGILKAIVGIFTLDFEKVFYAIGEILYGILQIVVGVFTAVVNFVIGVVAGILHIIADFSLNIINYFLGLKGDAIATWGDVWNFILDGTTYLVTVVSALWDSIVLSIKNAVSAIASTILIWVEQTYITITEFIAQTMLYFTELSISLTMLWNEIKTALLTIITDLVIGAGLAWLGFVSDVTTAFQTVKTTVVSLMTDAYNGALGIAGQFVSVGSAIIDGIVGALQAGAGAVVDTIVGIAKGALDAIKSFFGISSPSKLMIEQFGYVAEGMQIGLSKGAESIFNIADKLSSGIADALTSPIAMSALSPAGIEQTAQLNQSIVPQEKVSPQQDRGVVINFNNPIVRDELDIKRLSAEVADTIARNRKQ